MTPEPWSQLSPVPAPGALPPGYPRHAPSRSELRTAITGLVDATDWPALRWPELVDGLISLGRTDIPLSRLAEGHIDALRILDQAGAGPRTGALYGVWASRSAGTGVAAEIADRGLRLSGSTLR